MCLETKLVSTKIRSREAVEDARDAHRQAVWKWRKELYAAIKPLKRAAYKIFRSDPEKVNRSDFDLKSRV